ncbi:hypothetical protein SDC9_111515 [bioreactor metagenome]|uniref:Uncharacterized protein n=1 Tax=bioreactor metagenome TaxID=1076179 RepID=A0A645BHP8_9ZZZZ
MRSEYTKSSLDNPRKETRKQDKPKVGKVIKGKAKIKKKSEISKIASTMIVGEVQNIKEYIIYDVIIPVITDTIGQIVQGSIDILFRGEVRSNKYGGRSSNGVTKVSYSSIFDDRRDDRRRDDRRTNYVAFDDVTFESKADAMEVLDRMDEIVDQYKVVRVADLFEMAGYSGNGSTDHNYGWTSTASATVDRNRHGEWYIKIQRPSPIR